MIKRELSVFLVVGLLTVLVDFCAYSLLLFTDVLEIATAKTIGFLTGTAFAYVANKLWTFRHTQSDGRVFRFGALYACTLVINVGINAGVLNLLGESELAFGLAFVLATGSSAVLNFLGMKYFVFIQSLA